MKRIWCVQLLAPPARARSLFLGIGLSIAITAMTAGHASRMKENKEPTDVAVDGSYTDPDGMRIDVKAICSVDTRSISCWNMHGDKMPEVAGQLSSRFAQSADHLIQFEFGKSAYFVVVESPLWQRLDALSWSLPGAKFPFLNLEGRPNDKSNRRLIEIYEGDNVRKVNLVCHEQTDFPEEPLVALKAGASVLLQGIRLTFKNTVARSYQQKDPSGKALGRAHKSWDYIFNCTGAGQGPNPTLIARAVATVGEVVSNTDEDGRPIPPEPSTFYIGSISDVELKQSSPHSVTFTLTSDPRYVKNLKISGFYNRDISFPNIPLARRKESSRARK